MNLGRDFNKPRLSQLVVPLLQLLFVRPALMPGRVAIVMLPAGLALVGAGPHAGPALVVEDGVAVAHQGVGLAVAALVELLARRVVGGEKAKE